MTIRQPGLPLPIVGNPSIPAPKIGQTLSAFSPTLPVDQVRFSGKGKSAQNIRAHEMPYGASILPDGRVRFRLWAPGVIAGANPVLILETSQGQRELALTKASNGWLECVSDQAKPGDRYGFRVSTGANGHSLVVPDPASRFQPDGVHGLSRVENPGAYRWKDTRWKGLPWEKTVIYELHVGTFSPEGTYAGVKKRLDDLKKLGVTAIELMPLSQSPGKRNWGYDGVLPYAPFNAYGSPEELKDLIDTAHQKGMMVFLDVVYNHFGPEGNYLGLTAPQFFTDKYQTPWGTAIDFEGGRHAREFFINNALYWLKEFHFDGLRLDAVHMIQDASNPHFLYELSRAVRAELPENRQVHLMLENDDNQSRYLTRRGLSQGDAPNPGRKSALAHRGENLWYEAQWNDDFHHALHVLLTGETDGYYQAYDSEKSHRSTVAHLGRSLTEGFSYQNEATVNRPSENGNKPRGEVSRHLPPTAFINFIQNHDQIGNRPLGDRITTLASPEALKAALPMLLLSPAIPMLFMGEEFGSKAPFYFFCDFGPELAPKVTEGRRNEFSAFRQFRDPAIRKLIPDPCDIKTFEGSQLDWRAAETAEGKGIRTLYQKLLTLRKKHLVPLLPQTSGGAHRFEILGDKALRVEWQLGSPKIGPGESLSGKTLSMLVNLGETPVSGVPLPEGKLLYQSDASVKKSLTKQGILPAYSTAWWLR